MKNTRVTNKMLHEKIENLIKSNKHLSTPKSQEVIKTSRIKNLYRQSSAFYLWLITGVLGYAHKLPIVRNIIAALSLWYGRTTWWRMLIMLRKAFITFNAIIGMYMVYATTGFGFDNLLVGFMAMGENYVNIFWNFNKRVFNWLYDLFDHKIMPNLPGNPPSNPSSWWSGSKFTKESPSWFSGPYNNITPENTTSVDSLRKTYMDELLNKSVNININSNPWYKDITTWLMIGGVVASAGVFYIGYKIIMDPLFINDLPVIGNWFRSPLDQAVAPEVVVTPTQETVTAAQQAAEIVDPSSSKGKGVVRNVGVFMLGGLKRLNPATWFMSSVDHESAYSAFKVAQSSNLQNNNYYPFTAINPYDSWIKRMRISWLGETALERENRYSIRSNIWAALMPPLNLESSPISSSVSSSVTATPRMASVGLGLNLSNIGDTGFMAVSSKLSSLATTPTNIPLQLPEIANPFNNPLADALERLVNTPVTSPVIEAISTSIPVAESSSTIINKVSSKSLIEIASIPLPVTPVVNTPISIPVESIVNPLKLSNKFSALDDLEDSLYNNL